MDARAGSTLGISRAIVAVFLFHLFFPSFNAWALDPLKSASQYGHDVWLRQNGLPANGVHVSLQTHDGYLWFGTTAGLFRFDGYQFTRIPTDTSNADNPETIYSLCEGHDGSLWIGTANSWLSYLKDGRLRRYGQAEGIMARNSLALCERQDGHVWLGTSSGLYRFSNGEFTSIPIEPKYISSLAEDRAGRLWVGTYGGLRVFENGREAREVPITAGTRNQVTTSVYVDHQGRIWIGTFNGLFCYDGNSFRAYSTSEGMTDSYVTAICEDRDGNLWVGTNSGGLNRLLNGRWTSFTAVDGLTGNNVSSLLEDREGSLWIGTSEGLDRLKDVPITPFTTKEGLASDHVSSILQAPDGSMYFLSDVSSLVTHLTNGKSTVLKTSVGPAFLSKDGSIWIGQTGLLEKIDNARITRYDTAGGMPNRWITAIGEDQGGLLIYIDEIGLRRFRDGRLSPFLLKSGPYTSTEYVSSMYCGDDGVLWIGTSNGLLRIENGEMQSFSTSDGLVDVFVNSILDDHHGSLWFTSPHAGVTRYMSGKFIPHTTRDGLFTNEIDCALADDNGDLWLSSPRGIGLVSRKELDDFAAKRITSFHTRVFETADGMKTDECFNLWQPAGWKAQDGRLWFPTKKGAVVIDPKTLKTNTIPPPVLIENLVVDEHDVPLNGAITIPPGGDKFEIHYTALSLLVPTRVHFKYRLEGYDRDWVNADTRRVAYYTGLRPDRYTFRVIACNNDGVWNEQGASLEFTVAPRFIQSIWFYGLCVFAGALVIAGAFRLRVKTLKQRGRQLEELVQQRTKELQSQRSFLRTIIDLNPSFIFAKDREGRFTLANRALASEYGAEAEDLVGKTDADFNSNKDQVNKFRQDDLQVMDTLKEKFDPEEEFTDSTGEKHWKQVIKIPIVSESGKADQMLGVAIDITERKRAEELVKVSLHEKEVLLKEIHHRVKNNLQVVSSLLSLQAGEVQDQKLRGLLGESQQRVRAMALIHEKLYQADNLSSVDFGEYIKAVTRDLRRSFGVGGVSIVPQVEPIRLQIDTAIPCGLIVNELVTNALKHGFSDGREGSVTVTLSRGGPELIRLRVSDDGKGFPVDKDFREMRSMGMTLIVSLTEQISGTIRLERTGGTSFQIEFPG